MDESTPTCNKRFASVGDSPDRGGPARLSGVDCDHARSRRVHQWRDPLRRDDPPAEERWHSLRQSHHRCGNHSRHQSRHRRQGHGRSSRRENNRRSGRIARPPRGIFSNGRPFCQVARGDRHGRWHSQPGLHRGQRAGVGSLCRVVPGSRTGPRRRAGSAHGRRAYSGAVLRGNGGSPAHGLHPALRTTSDAGGHDPEAQHGASGIDLPQARNGGRGGRRHGEVSLASRPRRRSGDCVPVGRPIRRTGLGPFECHECQIQVATALGVGVFVCPRHPATGFGDLARRGGPRVGGTASSVVIEPGATGRRAVANTMPRWTRT